jgi:hypothetical protein
MERFGTASWRTKRRPARALNECGKLYNLLIQHSAKYILRELMRKFSNAIFLIFFIWPAIAVAAPQALYGKSITISWNETRSQRDGQAGAFRPVSIPFIQTYYISTQGRIFTRSTAKGGSGAGFGSVEGVGHDAPKGFVDARNIAFKSNGMVINTAFGGAGRHIDVSFDGGFAGCSARVVTAMQSGAKTAVVRSIATGSNVEFESVSAGAASCSVATGNAFAQ